MRGRVSLLLAVLAFSACSTDFQVDADEFRTRRCMNTGECEDASIEGGSGAGGTGSGGITSGGSGGNAGAAGMTGGSAGTAAAGGRGGTTMTDGSAGMSPDGTAGVGGCPATDGPTMVRVPEGFCIDSTEVTNAHYAAFLAAKGADTTGQDTWCSWNTSFEPAQNGMGCTSADYDPVGRPDFPIVCVDWCDAVAYCSWAGRRLCGRIGGGATPFTEFALASSSQWYAACSAGGTRQWPTGNSPEGFECNISGDSVQSVGAQPCEGGYQGLFDMSGNAGEWEDSCNAALGSSDACRVRGGFWYFLDTDTYECAQDDSFARNLRADYVGFRCCAPP